MVSVTRKIMKPQPREGYPRHSEHPISFGGRALVSEEGPHRGAVFGTWYPDCLDLYGPRNFRANGGMAWQTPGRRQRIVAPCETVGIKRGRRWWWIVGKARKSGGTG